MTFFPLSIFYSLHPQDTRAVVSVGSHYIFTRTRRGKQLHGTILLCLSRTRKCEQSPHAVEALLQGLRAALATPLAGTIAPRRIALPPGGAFG